MGQSRQTRAKVDRLAAPELVSRSWPATFPPIWSTIAAIPAGQVRSYGQVAERAGLPRRARLVAQALRAAPDDLDLPWHRVIRSDGRIAFEPGSSAFRTQKRRLRSEGVLVSDNGRVTMAAAASDLDASLWRL